MEIAIIAAVVVLVAALARKGRGTTRQNVSAADIQRKKDEADELITVILPTINNDR